MIHFRRLERSEGVKCWGTIHGVVMSSTFATPEKGPHEEKETKDKELETTGVRNPDHQVRDIAQDIKEEVEGSKDVMLKIDVSLGHRQRKEEGLNQRRRLFLQGLLGL